MKTRTKNNDAQREDREVIVRVEITSDISLALRDERNWALELRQRSRSGELGRWVTDGWYSQGYEFAVRKAAHILMARGEPSTPSVDEFLAALDAINAKVTQAVGKFRDEVEKLRVAEARRSALESAAALVDDARLAAKIRGLA